MRSIRRAISPSARRRSTFELSKGCEAGPYGTSSIAPPACPLDGIHGREQGAPELVGAAEGRVRGDGHLAAAGLPRRREQLRRGRRRRRIGHPRPGHRPVVSARDWLGRRRSPSPQRSGNPPRDQGEVVRIGSSDLALNLQRRRSGGARAMLKVGFRPVHDEVLELLLPERLRPAGSGSRVRR